jgi:hypothetical protein
VLQEFANRMHGRLDLVCYSQLTNCEFEFIFMTDFSELSMFGVGIYLFLQLLQMLITFAKMLSNMSLDDVAFSRGSGKHPQLMPSTPRWAVANGAGVILSVCDEEVARYETANLTAAAVPALLLPPPTTPLDEHLVAGLPPLEPYARLFHRYTV